MSHEASFFRHGNDPHSQSRWKGNTRTNTAIGIRLIANRDLIDELTIFTETHTQARWIVQDCIMCSQESQALQVQRIGGKERSS